MYLLWYALFTEDVTVLIASKNQSHALEIAARVRFAYEELPSWIKAGLKYYNRHNIEFDNGSRIVSEATTEKTGRGLSISKLYLDELAFINPRIQELMWASLAPTLSTGGSAIISSTPNGDTELYAQLWRRAMSGTQDAAGTNFVPFQVHWRDHPERDDSYWDTMVNMLGLLKTRQEVGCLVGTTEITTRNKLTGIIKKESIEDVAKELLSNSQDTLSNDLDSSKWEDSARRRQSIVRDSSHQRGPQRRPLGKSGMYLGTRTFRETSINGGSFWSNADRQEITKNSSRTKRNSDWWKTIARDLSKNINDQKGTVRSRVKTFNEGSIAFGGDQGELGQISTWEKTLIKTLSRAGRNDALDTSGETRSIEGSKGLYLRMASSKRSRPAIQPISTGNIQSANESKLVFLIPNTILEILTPTGFQDFDGVRISRKQRTLKIETSTTKVECSDDHLFGNVVASTLRIGDLIQPGESVINISEGGSALVYDPVNVKDGHQYLSNGLISHNCEFLSSDAMLISSMKLQQIRETAPIFEDMGFRFWVQPESLGGAGKTYLVSIDPATGNAKDYSVIEVFDFPGLNQIAEWRSNEINIPLLYAKVKWLLNKLTEPIGRGRAEVLWTFERNGIGEAMCALYVSDERQPEFAELYSDAPGKYGVYTTGKTKIVSCLQLKTLIEKVNNGMKLNSDILLFELKNFIARGGSYEAKTGSTDDCVMATVGITRLIKRLAEYNDEAFKQVNEYVDPNEVVDEFGGEPVPFGIL
jgi:hypothetical protein